MQGRTPVAFRRSAGRMAIFEPNRQSVVLGKAAEEEADSSRPEELTRQDSFR